MDFPSTIDFPLLHRFFDSSMKNKNRIQKTPNNYYYYLKKKKNKKNLMGILKKWKNNKKI